MPSQAVEQEFHDAMRPLAEAMCRTTRSAIRRVALRHARPKIVAKWDAEAHRIASRFVERVVQYTRGAFSRAVGAFKRKDGRPPTDFLDAQGRRSAHNLTSAAAKLVRSIPRLYFSKVEAAILSYNEGNLTQRGFDERIEELGEQVMRRIRNIAKDQNNKATETLMISRLACNGIRKVKWCHSHLSEVPREYHLRRWDGHTGKRNGRPNGLNGYIFDIENPPVIDLDTGERGYPAQLINCKCFLVPVIEE